MAESNIKTPPPPPAASSRDNEDDVIERRTLRDYYIILRERLWIALPIALLASVGYGYWKMREVPLFFSRATMQFEKPDTVVTSQMVVDTAIRNDMDMNTAIQQINSAVLRRRVIESFSPEEQKILQRAAMKRSPPGTPPSSIGLPLGSVNPVPLRNSYLINIEVVHEDPEAAMIIANRYVREFMEFLLDNASGKNNAAIEYLTTQANRLQKEAEAAEQKLLQYQREQNLLSLDSSQNIIGDALKRVGANRTEASLSLLNIEQQFKQVEAFKAEGKNLLEISYISSHGAVPSLKSQLNGLQQEQILLADRYLDRHPKMIDVSNRVSTTQEQLEKAIELAIADLRTRLAEARQTVKTYEQEFAKREAENMKLNDLSIEYRTLQDQASIAKTNYRSVQDRLIQTKTTKNYDKIPLRPLDEATIAGGPSSPNKSAITRTAVGIGVLVFLGIAVGLSFIDDRIKSAWDVESFIGANLLGIIPDLTSMKDEEKYTLLLGNKQAPGVEAFLSVYSSVKIHSKLDFPKSILVTSTIPGEGKTLISCNVAGSFARHGKRTLLVDCDLRRPMLHRHFKQQNSAGLIPWFEGGASLEGDLATNPNLGIIKIGENLSLLCSGGRSKSPTELLENPIFGQLLEKLKREYDLVIVDSPPLGAVTDSLLIAERIDEVIYVCRFNRAYRKHIRLYMRALRNGKNEVLGVVLNGLSPRRIEYYSNYRYYRSYKKYYGAQT
jgi:succinoglycan biosynthesis transport protein ExoP